MATGTIKRTMIAMAALIAVVAIAYWSGRRSGFVRAIEDSHRMVDTLVIRDTITQYEPIVEERVVLQKILVPVERTDTLWKCDTLYVYLDREQLVWQDSLSKVYVSGILPQVDSVEHYIQERIVTRELTRFVKEQSRWSVGINAGYGVHFGDKVKTAPYVGVGVSYNLLSW